MMLSFFSGVLVGMCIVIAYSTYQLIKLKSKKEDMITKLKDKMNKLQVEALKDAEKGNSIKERLVQAARLAETQNELRAQAELPSKNALHSRHKNGIVGEVFELEAQKLSILKTVLGDGFDPLITVIREGGTQEEILLSVYVAQAEEVLGMNNYQSTPASAPEVSSTNGPRKAGKFVIYTGGKNDDGTIH